MTTWADLKINDWIVCPVSGLPEQVTLARPVLRGRRFLRTTRHDHNRSATEPVALADRV